MRQRKGEKKANASMESEDISETEYSEWEKDKMAARKERKQMSSLPSRISEEASAASSSAAKPNKWQKMKTRTVMAFTMFAFMFLIFALGPFYCSLFVLVSMIGIFKEIIHLKRNQEKEERLPGDRKINNEYYYFSKIITCHCFYFLELFHTIFVLFLCFNFVFRVLCDSLVLFRGDHFLFH